MIHSRRDRDKLWEGLLAERARREDIVAHLRSAETAEETIIKAVRSLDAVIQAKEAEIAEYDKMLTAPDGAETWALADLPRVFVALRDRKRMSQAAFGVPLGLRGNQIARYEKIGYAGLSLKRLVNMLDAVHLEARVILTPWTEPSAQAVGDAFDGAIAAATALPVESEESPAEEAP